MTMAAKAVVLLPYSCYNNSNNQNPLFQKHTNKIFVCVFLEERVLVGRVVVTTVRTGGNKRDTVVVVANGGQGEDVVIRFSKFVYETQLCTLEFETRPASYYWLLDALSLYQPYVWEYSRLNITYNVMSKRKLNILVTKKYLDGWDDPRSMLLAGLRRRGVTSTAINTYVREIGITRSDGSMIRLEHLEHHVRNELNKTAPRTMVVLRPLKVVITNLDARSVIYIDAKKWPNAPKDDTSSNYKVPFSRVVYIDRDDFKDEYLEGYHGLAPGQDVLLRHAFPIKYTNMVHSEDKTSVVEIHAEYDPEKNTKPKASQSQTGIGVLHWVAEPSPGVDPLKVEVRLFDKLFKSENPGELDNWLDDLNPESKVVIPSAYGVPSLKFAEVGDKFQFERLGYFVVDKDSTPEKLVFNRTVALRDTYKPGSK
ncbi:glutamine-tRNA ligase, putative / glutaminyl-tRNA synthetase, putative / GlnRS [Artemisia annua]|uniref:glutamine--tRNA ligase n=1 Tax=Artemisia annua TaxID=35608 RepID=A0A2U1KVT3_ARTAN|nr:glutamine-tRNA ligase, putative / glutaminyl-tRNA synthetase, putative / GlnRS [Artemisia annua]